MATKTEAPTPRRLRRAESEGDAPVSPALVAALSFCVVVTLLPAFGTALFAHLSALVRSSIAHPETSTSHLAWGVLSLAAPVLGAGALASLAVGLFQTRGIFALKRIRLDFGRLDPGRGLTSLLSAERLLPILLSFVGAVCVLGLTLSLVEVHLPSLAAATGSFSGAVAALAGIARSLLKLAAAAGVAFAAVDLAVRHKSWIKRLRMTNYEVLQEQRETEGDPHLRRARRSTHEEVLEQGTLAELGRATLLIVAAVTTEEARVAVALHYDEASASDEPPRVVASGRGAVATYLEQSAFAYGLQVKADETLAHALSTLKVGAAIPTALYEPVAALLGAALSDA